MVFIKRCFSIANICLRYTCQKHSQSSMKGMEHVKVKTKRRSKNELKELILEALNERNISTKELYNQLGYSGNPSKTFVSCIEELISTNQIEYTSENIYDPNNNLKLVK